MKLIHKLLSLQMVLLALAFTACDRDYDAPVLNEPVYSLPADAQTITIKDLRQKYAAATSDNAITIEDSLFLHARVCGDDRSGNIFKTLYIQDETGGITFLVDQSDVYNDYAAGQEVFVDLKGLCISVYGDEQQIGHPSGYLYRTPYEDFKEHVHKNRWFDESKLNIKEFDNISHLSDDPEANKFTLVRLTGVHFTEAGKANFAEANGYGTHDLSDAYGNTISVRTSNYADFAATELPVGTGNVIAVLGRFRGSWQLTIRSINDVYGFDGVAVDPDAPVTPDDSDKPADGETVIFHEQMGSANVSKVDGYWPYVSKFTNWSCSDLTFTDVNSTLSVRAQSGVNNVWFPANKDNHFQITGFSTEGYTSLTLTYELAANLYNSGTQQDLAAMTGTFNGQSFATPAKLVTNANGDNNKFYPITVELPVSAASATSELNFMTGADNTAGLRLANIKLVGKK